MGEFVSRNMYSRFKWIKKKINKRNLFHLVGCLHRSNDTRCHERQKSNNIYIHNFSSTPTLLKKVKTTWMYPPGCDFVFVPSFMILKWTNRNSKRNKGRNSRLQTHTSIGRAIILFINLLTPNDDYSGRTATLTSKYCILYIYSTNIGTEHFKHGIYSPFFFCLFKMQFVS